MLLLIIQLRDHVMGWVRLLTNLAWPWWDRSLVEPHSHDTLLATIICQSICRTIVFTSKLLRNKLPVGTHCLYLQDEMPISRTGKSFTYGESNSPRMSGNSDQARILSRPTCFVWASPFLVFSPLVLGRFWNLLWVFSFFFLFCLSFFNAANFFEIYNLF